MAEDTVTSEEVKTEVTEPVADNSATAPLPGEAARVDRRDPRRRNDRKPRREPRAKPEFDQRVLSIRRVTRVSSGGRRFSFSVAIVVGNHKGNVGVGTGKAGDTSLAMDKAVRNARKLAINVKTTPSMSIPHEVYAKEKSAVVHLKPAKGRGIIAGSSVRDVIELAGLKDVSGKLRSPSKNKLNAARSTIKALASLKIPRVESAKVAASN